MLVYKGRKRARKRENSEALMMVVVVDRRQQVNVGVQAGGAGVWTTRSNKVADAFIRWLDRLDGFRRTWNAYGFGRSTTSHVRVYVACKDTTSHMLHVSICRRILLRYTFYSFLPSFFKFEFSSPFWIFFPVCSSAIRTNS